jgi:muramoyltetrapeptide carboxypeptidase
MIFKSLSPGSSIALVAPSSPFDPVLYEKGREILDTAGYRIVSGRSVLNRRKYLAGTDLERAQDLTSALLDPEIKAVICIRGGYGSGRLLPWLPFSKLGKTSKICLGHSDMTFLHLALVSQAGWTTFHGPNLTGMAESPERAENVLNMLSGNAIFEWNLDSGQILRHGRATGPVLGGNLTCLAHLIGTPYIPKMAGALLLIEDNGEALYRLDRMINHLKLAGILPALGGILLGEFEDCAANEEICDMVMDHVRFFDFPVVHSLPFGHGARNEVIPFGSPFLLDTHERVLKALDSPVAA